MEVQSGWGDLPLELLSKVAGGRDALKAMIGVSKTWRAGYEDSVILIRQDVSRVDGLPLLPRFGRVHTSTLFDISLWPLRNSGVKNLDISGCIGVNSEYLSSLGGAVLESLTLRGGEEIVTGLKALRDLPKLEAIMLTVLIVDRKYFDEEAKHSFPSLESLTSLTKLHLKIESNLGPHTYYPFSLAVQAVQGLAIRDLKFTGASDFDHLEGSSFEYLKGLPLTNLEVSLCHYVIDKDLENLREMPLTSLALWGVRWDGDAEDELCEVSDVGLNVFIGMPLTSLFVSGFYVKPPGCLEALQGLPLTSLTMSLSSLEEDIQGKYPVSDAEAEILSSLPLTELCLHYCIMSDNGRARLEALPLDLLCITG